MIKILFFGDIVGKPGRQAIAKSIPELKKEFSPDLIMANAENLAHGTGLTSKTLKECQTAGIDFFTSGNHIWKKPEALQLLKDEQTPVIRPANFISDYPGSGYKKIAIGSENLVVVNLNGQVFIEEQFSNKDSKCLFVDFHAEATSEKVAMGWYLDGRVSAVIGTHTHVPTADEQILPQGTAYQTDVGMCGLKDSVIGVDKDIILNNFTNDQTRAHDISEHGLVVVNAVLVTINTETGKAVSCQRINREIKV